MAVIQLDITEVGDVLDVLQQRGLEVCYSVESDGVYFYGSDSELEEVESIIWAVDVVQESGFHQRASLAMPYRVHIW